MLSIYVEFVYEDSAPISANPARPRTLRRAPHRLALWLRTQPRNRPQIRHPLPHPHAPRQIFPPRNQVGHHRRRRPAAPHLPPHSQRRRTRPLDICKLARKRSHRAKSPPPRLQRRQSMISAAFPRSVAIALLRFAIRIAPHDTHDWGHGMLSELNHVEGNWSALLWSLGGAGVLAKHAMLAL